MFNGLDELEEFAEQLAPLTPEEAAAWEKRKVAAKTGRPDNGPVPENTDDIAWVQETAPELGTVPEPVSEIAAADERECAQESRSVPLQNSDPEIEAVQQAEVSEAQPVLVSPPESAPEQVAGATTRPYARYAVVGGLLLLGLAALLL